MTRRFKRMCRAWRLPRLQTWRATTTLLAAVLGVLLVAPGSAWSDSFGSLSSDPFAPAPTISSDRPDYSPADIVVLTSTDWFVGEAVHIVVNDEDGQTWSYTTDVIADDNGSYTASFQLPDQFIANYRATATGSSGRTASTTFTDSGANINGPSPVVSGSTQSYSGTGTGGCNASGYSWSVNPSSTSLASIVGSTGVSPVNVNFTAPGTAELDVSITGTKNGNPCSGSGSMNIVIQDSTTTTVTSSLNPSTYGQSVTFTATVTGGAS